MVEGSCIDDRVEDGSDEEAFVSEYIPQCFCSLMVPEMNDQFYFL